MNWLSLISTVVVSVSEECKNLRYFKVESSATRVKISEAVACIGDTVTVFGGAAGDFA